MKAVMRLATIGTGEIVEKALASIQDVEGIHLVAAYSRSLQKAKQFAQKHHMSKAYDCLEDLIHDKEVNTVYIASPNSCHYLQAKQVLQAGKHVILEKPFCTSLQEAQELFDLAKKHGVRIFEAIINIHTPNFGLLKDNLAMIGKPKQVFFNFSQYSSKYDRYRLKEVANVFNPSMGGGALVDLNVYNIHLSIALFGLPKKVTYYPVFGFNGIDTSGTLIMEYDDFTVQAIGAKDSQSPKLSWIQGEEGTFEIQKGNPSQLTEIVFRPVHPTEQFEEYTISIDQKDPMTFEFLDFLMILQEDNDELYKQYKVQTLQTMSVLEEALQQRNKKQ